MLWAASVATGVLAILALTQLRADFDTYIVAEGSSEAVKAYVFPTPYLLYFALATGGFALLTRLKGMLSGCRESEKVVPVPDPPAETADLTATDLVAAPTKLAVRSRTKTKSIQA